MAGVEDQVRTSLRGRKHVFYLAAPQYTGPDPYRPTRIRITWADSETDLRTRTVLNE